MILPINVTVIFHSYSKLPEVFFDLTQLTSRHESPSRSDDLVKIHLKNLNHESSEYPDGDWAIRLLMMIYDG